MTGIALFVCNLLRLLRATAVANGIAVLLSC